MRAHRLCTHTYTYLIWLSLCMLDHTDGFAIFNRYNSASSKLLCNYSVHLLLFLCIYLVLSYLACIMPGNDRNLGRWSYPGMLVHTSGFVPVCLTFPL